MQVKKNVVLPGHDLHGDGLQVSGKEHKTEGKHGQLRRTIIQGAIGRGGSYVHNINYYYNNKVMYDQTQRWLSKDFSLVRRTKK